MGTFKSRTARALDEKLYRPISSLIRGSDISGAIDTAASNALPIVAAHTDICPSCAAGWSVIALSYLKNAAGTIASFVKEKFQRKKDKKTE